MIPTETSLDELDLAVSAAMMKQPKLDLRHTPGDPFSPSRAEAAYRKLGFAVRWLNDVGKVDRHLGNTLAIVVNGLATVQCLQPPDDRDSLGSEWRGSPYFVDSQGVATFLFAGVGDISKIEVLGKFTVESFAPCNEAFERTMGAFLVVPPWNGLTWQQVPCRRDRLPLLPASIRFELARLLTEKAS